MSSKTRIWHISGENLRSEIVALFAGSGPSPLAGKKETLSLTVSKIQLAHGSRFSSQAALKYVPSERAW